MKSFSDIKTVSYKNYKFALRAGTSDEKAFREVVVEQNYQRRDFGPVAGETWIDGGANCGAFSVWAGLKGCKVIAFEPDPESRAMAQANVQLNTLSAQVRVIEAGLSSAAESGSATLSRNSANGQLWRNSLFKQWNKGESIQVKTEGIAKYWVPENCVKLDIEGAEMPILEAFAGQRVKKLVFEWSFDIDDSIERFRPVLARLKTVYPYVKCPESFLSKGVARWPKTWFPPCIMVYCQ